MTIIRPLFENYTYDQAKCLVEGGGIGENGKPKNIYMKGIFIQGGVRNHNGRVYPVSEIRNAVESVNARIAKGESVLGEADHPEGININIDRVSHVIESMWMDGPNGYGKLRVLGTPCGQIVRTLLEEGIKLGVSSRGEGQVDSSGDVSNFSIVTVDVVCTPSGPECFPNAVYESLMRGDTRQKREIMKLAEQTAYSGDPAAQKHLSNSIINFINNL